MSDSSTAGVQRQAQTKRSSKQQQPLQLPNGETRVLLHSCCAPCAGGAGAQRAPPEAQFICYDMWLSVRWSSGTAGRLP